MNEIADMNNVLGAKNLLPNEAVSQTISGVTLTKNSDGTVNVHGTNSSAGWINHVVNDTSELKKILGAYKGKKLILSTTNDYNFYTNNVNLSYDIGGNITYVVPAPKEIEFTVPNNIDSAEAIVIVIGIHAGATANVDNMGIMLRPASIQDDTYVPYSMTNREMTPYVQSISNPNLLDNPWFTVNQRDVEKGVSITTTTARYWWDRWYCNSNRTFTYNTDNSITSSNIDIWQIIEDGIKKLQGRTITLSLMLADGTIKSGSYDVPQGIPSTNQFISVFYNDGINIVFGRLPSGNAQFSVLLEQNKTIKAVKLELGTVSTLAMDSAPNNASELLKCQRYFVRFNPTDSYTAFGAGIYSSNNIFAEVTLPTVFRAKPNVSYSTVRAHSYGRNDVNISSIIVNNYINNIVSLKCAPGSGANFVNGDYCELQLDINNYLDLSCDL